MNQTQTEESTPVAGPDATAAARPDSLNQPLPRFKSWLWVTVIAIAGLLAAAAAYFMVIAPMFQPQVDPGIDPLQITRDSAANGSRQDTQRRDSITDPLFESSSTTPEHPLDPALAVAKAGLQKIQTGLRDYTALMVKQERVGDKLMDEEWIRLKVRHARPDQSPPVPKSFYLKFEKPRAMIGQEVIWVEGRDNDRLVAHAGGLSNVMTVKLKPTGFLAMRGNRYPITELGIETLVVRMLEKGRRDRVNKEVDVTADRETEIDGRPCTVITITHAKQREGVDFFKAKIYIDDQLDLPVGYEAFLWPETEGGPPVLLERYFYRSLETNVGLTDADFDPENPDYEFP